MAATPVAIIGLGHAQQWWLAEHLEEEGVAVATEVLDLRAIMTDPLAEDRVEHQRDGTCPKTIIAVLGQEAAAGACTSLCTLAFQKRQRGDAQAVVALGCHSGYHRTDTLGRISESMLNAFVDTDGRTIFNAQPFPL